MGAPFGQQSMTTRRKWLELLRYRKLHGRAGNGKLIVTCSLSLLIRLVRIMPRCSAQCACVSKRSEQSRTSAREMARFSCCRTRRNNGDKKETLSHPKRRGLARDKSREHGSESAGPGHRAIRWATVETSWRASRSYNLITSTNRKLSRELTRWSLVTE